MHMYPSVSTDAQKAARAAGGGGVGDNGIASTSQPATTTTPTSTNNIQQLQQHSARYRGREGADNANAKSHDNEPRALEASAPAR